ncbi:hypothetical protein NDU88_005624 [Pleurodeles waltl]|uniref:Uncharacterized protein n=1 Tax=Pleurodeles waltl TaxID=8319 RepID=A0AAV7NS20_PLEWA|nr:hypothetical protein NDU88_005624 [Pleurodeles waltl]
MAGSDVWSRGGVHPCLRDEGDVRGCGVQEVPKFNGVLVDGTSVDQDALEVVDGAWACGRGSCVVEDAFAGVAGEGSMGAFGRGRRVREGDEEGAGGQARGKKTEEVEEPKTGEQKTEEQKTEEQKTEEQKTEEQKNRRQRHRRSEEQKNREEQRRTEKNTEEPRRRTQKHREEQRRRTQKTGRTQKNRREEQKNRREEQKNTEEDCRGGARRKRQRGGKEAGAGEKVSGAGQGEGLGGGGYLQLGGSQEHRNSGTWRSCSGRGSDLPLGQGSLPLSRSGRHKR